MSAIFDQVVDPAVHGLLRRERELLVELRTILEAEQLEERRTVDDLLIGLDELFTIVVVGEFNAGKSSLINALFGVVRRKEGPIPVDDKISVLRYGEEPEEKAVSDFLLEQRYPVDFLRSITLVDTPGTNSIVLQHQELTEKFIPRADLVLFVTSIDRPLSESERGFLQFIAEWGKKIVFVLNKIDTKSDAEIDQVMKYLDENIRTLFGFDPMILPVSSKLALGSKTGELTPREWTKSRFEAFEDYIFRVLSEQERLRLKLQAPLDTVASLSRKQLTMIESRRTVLAGDLEKIKDIESQLTLAEKDLRSNFLQFTARMDNLMMELERRGVDFLDRYIRISHVMVLRDASRFREEFQKQVFYDWEGSVDRTIQESVDWLVRANMRLWKDTVEEFHRRRDLEALGGDLVGKVGREFAYNRDEVYSRIKSEAERRLRTYDVAIESRNLIDSALQGVLQSFGLGAGALGLGYLMTTIFSSVALDVTGLTAATMLLVSSFLILPYKRSKAKTEFKEKIDRLRKQLEEALLRESGDEIGRMIAHIGDSFLPYRRFFDAESEKIERFATRLQSIDVQAREIAAELGKL
ncbi:MAG: dynamin family protein [Acidobacteriota bacterium]